jgi:3-oxosteroid 1-dehydrogenase
VLGGMMVTRADIPPLLSPFSSMANLTHVTKLLTRHALDRLRHSRGTRLVMGNALVARLLYSLRGAGVPIRFETSLVGLIREEETVVGADVAGPQGRCMIRARCGVVLATGGLARNPRLRERLFPAAARPYSLAPEGNTGDGVTVGVQSGAALDNQLASAGLWMPCSIRQYRDGTQALFPHIVLDRAKPGLIAVDASGRRFANEADSYHDFATAMLETDRAAPSVPAYLICDRSFIRDFGIGLVYPRTRNLRPFLEDGYLVEGRDIRELASKIGVDGQTLQTTIATHNEDATTGIDQAFGRGTSDLNRINGDPANRLNPCMRPIGPGPFYAVAVWPADLATSAGLRADENGQVLRSDGTQIPGLYVCGNDMGSIFRGTYPGPGTTIGPAMVFGWRIAMHAAHRAEKMAWARKG